MFTVLVCADLFGFKVNLELTFAALPTIAELTRRSEEIFNAEMGAVRPAGAPVPAEGFRVSRVQIYDDVLLKWVDLISSTQLHEYDQLYVFQPQSPWQVDTQQDLPAPRPPSDPQYQQPAAGGGAPPQQASYQQPFAAVPAPQQQAYAAPGAPPSYAAAPPPPAQDGYQPRTQHVPGSGASPEEDRVRAVFDATDSSRKGYFEYAEMERLFRERGLDFSVNTVGELFYKADLDRDGRVVFEEWANWARIYPNTLECLWHRGQDTPEEAAIRKELQNAQNQIAANQAREAQIRRELDALEGQNRGLRDDVARGNAAANEAANRRSVLDPQERELIEEEIKLERQRDQMRMSQARFAEASARFNRGEQQKGSPRRAREAVPGY